MEFPKYKKEQPSEAEKEELISFESHIGAFLGDMEEAHGREETLEALSHLSGNEGLRPTLSPASDELLKEIDILNRRYGAAMVLRLMPKYIREYKEDGLD
jgi:hypothetical protein